ncbi:unnamed protein product [Phytophthora fragariaefolia]|uniref:Unnamed protein product n=1 Tax=Phytophthora fragariaefolia TaxID=1490495 RepID=A0A9W6XTV3_9STRA|nr:unnamed protein product [Phytophthora fragariaefolia]
MTSTSPTQLHVVAPASSGRLAQLTKIGAQRESGEMSASSADVGAVRVSPGDHSKASADEVVERVSVDTPAPESAPVSAAPVSAAVEVEEAPKTQEQADAPAAEADESAAPVEQPAVEVDAEEKEAAAVEAVEEAASAEEDKAPEAEPDQTPAEEEAPKSEAPVEEEAPKSEPAAVEVEAEAPKSEPAPEEVAEAPKSEAAVEEAPKSEPVEEAPKPEVVEAVAPVSEKKPTDAALTFTAEEVTFNDKGVAFYNFNGSDAANPANDVHVSKRYSDFKALHAQLVQLLADNQDGKASDLPALPKASLLQGRKNKKMLQDRKTQFTALLNVIAAHPVAAQSDVFKAFLA